MSSSASNPVRCLIADDNEIDRRLLTDMCQRFGWEAKAVNSGGELLAEMELARDADALPDCLLVDWHMPHLDGLSAIDTLLAAIPRDEMPAVVIVTALDEMMVEAAKSEIGDNRVLHKPVQADALRMVVEDVVGSQGRSSADGATDANTTATLDEDGWPALRGIDINTARTAFADDVEFYQELCDTFTAATPEVIQQIESLIPGDEREALRQLVHKLRGQLGTLGALEYQAKAGEVEVALVDGYTYQVDLEALLVHVKALMNEMTAWSSAAK